MLKDKGQLSFEDKWPSMRPTILKLLRQEAVSRSEWHDLFWLVHSVCLWDERGAAKVYSALREVLHIRKVIVNCAVEPPYFTSASVSIRHEWLIHLAFQDILDFIKQAQERVLSHMEDQALLKAYIAEWRKFFTQCGYLPMPFGQLETALQGKTTTSVQKGRPAEDSVVRKLMLDSWNLSIFSNIKERLQSSAMKLVHNERNGEAFDSQLVIGVRESYVNLCSNTEDKLQIYRENFERAYIEATEQFYAFKAPEQLEMNGVQNYMRYAESKLREEEVRAQKYLESCGGSTSVQNLVDSCVSVLVTAHKETILSECAGMIRNNETEKLQLMFKLMDRVPGEGIGPMLGDLETHIFEDGIADMVESAEVITQDSEKYVERLLMLFRRYSAVVREAFRDDPRFLTSRDKAYKRVVNDTSVFRLVCPTQKCRVC